MPIIDEFEKALQSVIEFLDENEINFDIVDENDIGVFWDEVAEDEEPDEDQWYKYFTTLNSGYFGWEKRPEVTKVYYSQSRYDSDIAEERIVEDFGKRYVGFGDEVLGNANRPQEVDYDEVDEDNIL
jgi:hypothetical protein